MCIYSFEILHDLIHLKSLRIGESPLKTVKEVYIELPKLKHLQSPKKLQKNYISKSASITSLQSSSNGAKGIAAAYNQQASLKTASSETVSLAAAQPQPNFVLSKQSTPKTRDSTPDELLLLHNLPTDSIHAIDDPKPDAAGIIAQEQAPHLHPDPDAQTSGSEKNSSSNSSLLADNIGQQSYTADKPNLAEEELEAALEGGGGKETTIDHGIPKMVFLPKPKGHRSARWRLSLAQGFDRAPSPMASRRQTLSDGLLTDIRTPRQRYCALLEQLYGSGDIRRGDGRKPTKVGFNALLLLWS